MARQLVGGPEGEGDAVLDLSTDAHGPPNPTAMASSCDQSMTDRTDPETHSPDCPYVVDRVAMLQRWDRLTFLHWKYPIASVQQLLPPGLVVESYDGWAWVGLCPS